MSLTRRWSSWLAIWLTLAAAVALSSPAPAVAAPTDLAAVAAQVEPSVARVNTRIDYQNVLGTGTGIVLAPGDQVLTNFHVVQGADRITAAVGGRSFAAQLVGYDRKRDIAVLQLLDAGGLPTAPLGDSSQLAVGAPVVALGNARGSDNPLTQEAGTVSAFGRTVSAEDELTGGTEEATGLIEFAAPVRAGDSGGPVVNAAGEVVGVTTAASLNYRMGPAGKGFAIPINDALGVVGQIRSGSRSDTVHIGPPVLLGIGVRSAARDTSGVLIQEVLRGGPAEQAGLLDGDVLTTLSGTPLNSATTLTSVLDQHYPGDVLDVTWIDRGGVGRSGKVTLTPGT